MFRVYGRFAALPFGTLKMLLVDHLTIAMVKDISCKYGERVVFSFLYRYIRRFDEREGVDVLAACVRDGLLGSFPVLRCSDCGAEHPDRIPAVPGSLYSCHTCMQKDSRFENVRERLGKEFAGSWEVDAKTIQPIGPDTVAICRYCKRPVIDRPTPSGEVIGVVYDLQNFNTGVGYKPVAHLKCEMRAKHELPCPCCISRISAIGRHAQLAMDAYRCDQCGFETWVTRDYFQDEIFAQKKVQKAEASE